jgi:hypothetical protein
VAANNPASRVPIVPKMSGTGYTQETTVLLAEQTWSIEERKRTSPSGTTGIRWTMSIKTTPVVAELNALELGRGPAQALLSIAQTQMRAIGQMAATATQRAREKAARAWKNVGGGSRLTARYSGGRTGAMPPNEANPKGRLFNDSGRLADTLFIRENVVEGAWTVNVAANRLDPSTFTAAAFEAMVRKLVALVPALAGQGLMDDPLFLRALAETKPVRLLSQNQTARIFGTYARAVFEAGRLAINPLF